MGSRMSPPTPRGWPRPICARARRRVSDRGPSRSPCRPPRPAPCSRRPAPSIRWSASRAPASRRGRRASASSGAVSSPLMTLSMLASPSVAAATSAATMRLPRSLARNAFALDHASRRSRFCGERRERGRLEHVDAKAALGGRRDRGELLFGKLRGDVAREHVAYLLRHRPQRGAHLFAHGRSLIYLRRGVDIDRRLGGVDIACQHQQRDRNESCAISE